MDLDPATSVTLHQILSGIYATYLPTEARRCLDVTRTCYASLQELTRLRAEHGAALTREKQGKLKDVITGTDRVIGDVCRAVEKCRPETSLDAETSGGTLPGRQRKVVNPAEFEALRHAVERQTLALNSAITQMIVVGELKPVAYMARRYIEAEEQGVRAREIRDGFVNLDLFGDATLPSRFQKDVLPESEPRQNVLPKPPASPEDAIGWETLLTADVINSGYTTFGPQKGLSPPPPPMAPPRPPTTEPREAIPDILRSPLSLAARLASNTSLVSLSTPVGSSDDVPNTPGTQGEASARRLRRQRSSIAMISSLDEEAGLADLFANFQPPLPVAERVVPLSAARYARGPHTLPAELQGSPGWGTGYPEDDRSGMLHTQQSPLELGGSMINSES